MMSILAPLGEIRIVPMRCTAADPLLRELLELTDRPQQPLAVETEDQLLVVPCERLSERFFVSLSAQSRLVLLSATESRGQPLEISS